MVEYCTTHSSSIPVKILSNRRVTHTQNHTIFTADLSLGLSAIPQFSEITQYGANHFIGLGGLTLDSWDTSSNLLFLTLHRLISFLNRQPKHRDDHAAQLVVNCPLLTIHILLKIYNIKSFFVCCFDIVKTAGLLSVVNTSFCYKITYMLSGGSLN